MTISTNRPFALGLLTLVAMLFPWHSTWAEQPVEVYHKTIKVGDLDIFYREAGPKDAPATHPSKIFTATDCPSD